MNRATLAIRPLTEQQRQMLAFIDPTADAYYLTVQAFVLRGTEGMNGSAPARRPNGIARAAYILAKKSSPETT